MSGHSLEIKNLSIALEALSRIEQTLQYHKVEELLREALQKQERHNAELADDVPIPAAPISDDDVPF